MPKTTDKEIRENCKMCKLVDDLAPSMSYCAKHKYFNPMPKNSTAKSIITEEELTDMFGEGGKEEVKEHYEDYEENLCRKPHNNGEGIESCLECQIIKLGI